MAMTILWVVTFSLLLVFSVFMGIFDVISGNSPGYFYGILSCFLTLALIIEVGNLMHPDVRDYKVENVISVQVDTIISPHSINECPDTTYVIHYVKNTR